MPAIELLRARRGEILAVAHRHGAHNVRVFGSVIRGTDSDVSDVDLLVDFEPDRSLLDLVGLQDEMARLLGRKADVLTEGALSPYLRDRVLAEAAPL